MTSLLPVIPLGAILYQRAVTNQIGATASSGNNLGYLGTNKSRLEVVSQLTGQDSVNWFNFTFQNNDKVRFNVINLDGTAPVHIQVYDGTGTRLIADNQGGAQQRKAFADLTSRNGLDLKRGNYAIRVTYGKGGDKRQKQDYAIQISSGNTFTNDYRTLANATTIQNTLLAGGSLGYTPLSATAAMLRSVSQGDSLDIFGTLSLFSVDIYA